MHSKDFSEGIIPAYVRLSKFFYHHDLHTTTMYRVQAGIPTTAVPTKSEQWRKNEINIAGQGELEAQRTEPG